ncbi:MAG: glycoside hydrolase family 43 protein [Porphyromonadaceae bacterium]|nr:glycoside hydrolase family 43 protein [Porphyromonadaceae bacterium]
MQTPARYLFPDDYMADPSAHVFEGKLYIYPSHDWESGVTNPDDGDYYNMRDYHVLSTENPESGKVTDHGVVLSLEEVPWAGRQLWACDVAHKGDTYYLYFPAKDLNDIFRIGVATSDKPYGPFTPQPDPMRGSYSIDPAVFEDEGAFYIYFGGLQGGQLQRYRDNKAQECGIIPGKTEEALPPRVARLSDDMLELAEEPQPVMILDKEGNPLKSGDPHRFFEAAWMHKYKGKYYFSYSTGTTHLLCYAIGDNPYGPFTYAGEILTPVVGWTTHHSICPYKGKWYLFFHDSAPSGKSYLRSLKVCELEYNPDGTLRTISGTVKEP